MLFSEEVDDAIASSVLEAKTPADAMLLLRETHKTYRSGILLALCFRLNESATADALAMFEEWAINDEEGDLR